MEFASIEYAARARETGLFAFMDCDMLTIS